jgi:ATP-dependent RNA helicase DDX5/DBP2
VALSGCDVLGCIKTWFGKTIAFALPLIQHCLAQPLVQQKDGPMVLVLALTKVVQQIKKKVKVFIQFVQGFKITIVVGGTNIHDQRSELTWGVEAVVATPERFIDHLQQGNNYFSRVS